MTEEQRKKCEEFANSTENVGSCPRGIMDAGKYAGYMAGFHSRDEEVQALKQRISELEQQCDQSEISGCF